MFLICRERNCGYDTGDCEDSEALADKVYKDGGELNEVSVCPKCGAINSLVDGV